jgi:rubrerythrin
METPPSAGPASGTATSSGDAAEAVRVLRRNWLAEKESARVYRDLAESEQNTKRREVLIRMAEAEERHADRWEKKLAELGGTTPAFGDGAAHALRRWVNRMLGTETTIRRMEAAEDRHTAEYNAQAQVLGRDEDARRILKEIAVEEKAHAKMLKCQRWAGRGVRDRVGRGGGDEQ